MAKQRDYAVPTGEFIQEWMDDTGVNAADLSRRLGVTPKHVSELLRGKVALTSDIAQSLERVTGVPAIHWNRLEALYRSDLARLAQNGLLAAQYDRIKAYPIKYLRQLGVVTVELRDKAALVSQVLGFFRVASTDALDATWSHGVAYRRAAAAKPQREALLTWLTAAERIIDFSNLGAFGKPQLEALLPQLRSMSCGDPDEYLPILIDRLAAIGVVLCFVPEVPGLGIHGATRWIEGHPVIQLSLRGKTDDQLWFTLFHELGHVLLHDTRRLFLAGEATDAETEADQFAADRLIPPDVAVNLPRNRNLDVVRSLATEIGVAPGIVLGRIQRDTKDYGWGHQLKRHFEFTYPQVGGSPV